MLNISNLRTEKVRMNWTGITYPLKAGTPIAADGTISNDGDAIGITIDDIQVWPAISHISIAVAGEVPLAEVEASSGLTFAAATIKALSGILFLGAGGAVTDGPESVLNKVTEIDEESTDEEYPSAKAVYTALAGKANLSEVWKPTTVEGALAAGSVTLQGAHEVALIVWPDSDKDLTPIFKMLKISKNGQTTISENDINGNLPARTFSLSESGNVLSWSDCTYPTEGDPGTENEYCIPGFILLI